jgi:hypothetical protein
LVHPDQIKGLASGECIVLRSPRVWNIRVPMISLDEATKKAIGPIKINHSRITISSENSFDAIGRVDKFIQEARNRRAPKPKQEKVAPKDRTEAGSSTAQTLVKEASADMPNDF